MKPARFLAIMAGLLVLAVTLWLNLRESDLYPMPLEAPPTDRMNGPVPPWLPADATLEETRVSIAVVDHDGWYRLFWAADDVYYYDDASYFGGALDNATAASWSGTWTLKGSVGGKPFALTYRLCEGEPAPGEVQVGPVRAPAGVFWFTRHSRPRPRTFSWALERP